MSLSRHRVRVGYGMGLLVLLLARPRVELLPAATLLLALGEALRLWAAGHIDKTERLATGGPYAHTRNPLYLGSLLLGLGVSVGVASPWALTLIAGYVAAFYPAVMREEGAFLARRFPEAYAEWQRDVPAFLPRLTPAGPRASRFAWSRVRRNREWLTAAAVPMIPFVLWAWARWSG